MAGLARGAAGFLPFGLGTWRGIIRLYCGQVNPLEVACDGCYIRPEREY
jgi:hypothetical protein